ncbi:MAG: molybdopterin-dependent oxidoreductase, partial [Pseudomonadota bacterium]
PAWVYAESRIDRPHVREGFLNGGPGGTGARGRERMVPVGWDEALSLASRELTRVRETHGPTAIFGGSYGWSSAGRFHHARTQVRRFLAATGGFTDQTGNYSWGAAGTLLPHVLGDASAVSHAATSWSSIAGRTDHLVAFGGLNPKNWRVTSGGAGHHRMPDMLGEAVAKGLKVTVVSPFGEDAPPGSDADWIAPRPNTDTAILLALLHAVIEAGRTDEAFLARYTNGYEPLRSYVTGASDGVPKTLAWAAAIADVPEARLRTLADGILEGCILLTAAWSLQRARHGEQPYLAVIALAAMLGQIGLPGGGFCFGYGSMNAVGADARRGYVPIMPGLPNPHGTAIPVARFADAFLNPGAEYAFNGRRAAYPDIRLVYWAGGNPFHHAQDLSRVQRAWARPETIIVHDPWWTPTAKRADIVLPATTTLERNDIGGSSRDPHVFAMPSLIDPVGQSRNDVDIFAELADRLGAREAYTEGRDEAAWLRHLWQATEAKGAKDGLDVPDFEDFWQAGHWCVPAPAEPEVLLSAFRASPDGAPLATPSGRIELTAPTIAAANTPDCPPHATWLEPEEWLGAALEDEFHLVTNQPRRRLHSQLYQATDSAGPEPVWMNPADAEMASIRHGDVVRLFNARGACLATANVTEAVRPRVLVMETGAWLSDAVGGAPDRNGNPNVLTADRPTSELTQACAALSALVRVAPWEEGRAA